MRTKRIIMALSVLFTTGLMVAEKQPSTDSEKGQSKQTILTPQSESIDKRRPKVPSRQVITCGYDESVFYLSFVLPEGQCTLSASDSDGHYEYVEFESTDLYIQIPTEEMHGDIEVTLQTALDKTYIGTITTIED